MSLAPTLLSIENLFEKLKREAYRACHAKRDFDKADHFYNFCITANAMRDYFFVRMGMGDKKDKRRTLYIEKWKRNPFIAAAYDIANTAKHFNLTKPAETKEVKQGHNLFIDIVLYGEEIREEPTVGPDLFMTLEDGTKLELWRFTDAILDYWCGFLLNVGIKVDRHSLPYNFTPIPIPKS